MIPLGTLGATGLLSSRLGLGGGPLGDTRLGEAEAERLVHHALALGVRTIDTAPSYGDSEVRLGRALAGRRDDVTLVTKLGYGVPDEPDWTPRCIARGLDAALARLRTDHLDVALLHSCPRATLEGADLFEPLRRAKEAGKLRAFGYAGDGEPLACALALGVDVVELSLNLVDRSAEDGALPEARRRGAGVLAKRALANAVWTHAARPARDDLAIYWDRLRALALPDLGLPADELAVRFAAFAPGVDCALVGTSHPEHLARLLELVSRGPLPAAVRGELDAAWRARGGWSGMI